jgi:hypothetical protein
MFWMEKSNEPEPGVLCAASGQSPDTSNAAAGMRRMLGVV